MATRRTTRGALSQDRVQERNDLENVPSNVGDCIFRLRIVEDSQVYRDLILAIRQFTGYTKKFPNDRGQVEPRRFEADGTVATTFRSAFKSVVDSFLVDRKGGKVFFPHTLPDDADWKGGYIDMEGFPRLVFENSEDERDIRVNMRLLFEALKGSNSLPVSSTGEMFDCEKANLMKLFDTEDCFICGDSDPVSRVKCQKCNCHFHSYCYAMARVPEADEKRYCRRCTKIIDHAASPKADTPRTDIRGAQSPMLEPEDDEANSINMLGTPSPNRSDSPVSNSNAISIFPDNKDNIIVLARLKSNDAYRLIDISDVDSLKGLFEACGTVLQIQVKRFYIYLPDNDGVLEFLVDESASFKMALKMFQDDSDNEKVVAIRVLVLAEGETY